MTTSAPRPLGLLVVLSLAAVLVPGLRAPAADAAPAFWPGVVSVKVDPGHDAPSAPGLFDVNPTFPGADADPAQADLARWFTATVTDGTEADVVAALLGRPGVTHAERVPVLVPAALPDDPRIGEQWHLEAMGVDDAWDHVRETTLTLGIIDTQFEVSHPDLVGRLADRSGRVGAVEAYTDGCAPGATHEDHGTVVAGIAAATGDNGRGVAGVAYRARVVAVQAGRMHGSDCFVGGEWVQALRDLASDGVAVINLSFATPERTALISDTVRYAINRGALVVAAAGNTRSTVPHYPAAEAQVVGVGATVPGDRLWEDSNRGPWVDVVAPGDRMLTTCRAATYCLQSGTSIAAAATAATALLVAEVAGPDVRGTRLRARLLDAAVRLDDAGQQADAGRGRVAAGLAITDDVVRLFGADRFETAVAIDAESNPSDAIDRIVVVPGNAPGDAGWTVTLPASGLFHDGRTAVVVTDQESLNPVAAEEIARLATRPGVEIVLPGDNWYGVGPAVEQALSRYTVSRVAGDGVAGTAARIADLVVAGSGADRVLVARGDTFADALSLAGPAAAQGLPLLYVQPDGVPTATCDWLGDHAVSTIHIAGGTSAISDRVAEDLRTCGTRQTRSMFGSATTTVPDVTRDAGATRIETAVAIARRHFPDRPERVAVANGWKWPDAVTGGALAAAYGAPILLVPSEVGAPPASVNAYLDDARPTAAFVLGGPAVVTALLERTLEARI